MTEKNSSNFQPPEELFPELKLIKVYKKSLELMKLPLKDQTLWLPWLKNSTDTDADSLNGDLFYKSTSKKINLPNQLFKKTLGDWPDMPPSAKKMDQFPLLNPKFWLTELTLLNKVKKSLKKFYLLFSEPYNNKISSLKDVY